MGVPKGKNEIFTQAAKTYINKKIAERFIEAGQHQYLPKPDGAAAIRWGRENELAGIFEAEQRFGIRVEKTGFGQETIVHESLPLAGTPDGFIGDDGLMEVKCPYSPENHIENMRLTTDTIALFRIEYYYQMQCLMFLTNRQYCYFVSYDPRMKKEYRLFGLKIPRNDNVISQIEIKIILAAQVLNSQNQNQNQNQ
jgi:exodeoxyribonuclease (lambda-induced)